MLVKPNSSGAMGPFTVMICVILAISDTASPGLEQQLRDPLDFEHCC